jgi:hypothetical protein
MSGLYEKLKHPPSLENLIHNFCYILFYASIFAYQKLSTGNRGALLAEFYF